jgi:hypothetical protein
MALLGPAGDIQASVLKRFNDKGAAFLTDDGMLDTLNEVHRLVAKESVFRVTETFDSVSDQYIYDLSSVLDEDYIQLIDLTWEGDTNSEPMRAIPNVLRFKAIRRQTIRVLSTSRPCIYTVDGFNLKVWPAPSSSASDAFEADYAYMPGDIENDAGYEFPSPINRAWYPVYVNGALWISYEKSAPSQKSKAMIKEKYALFQEGVHELWSATYLSGSITVRPG